MINLIRLEMKILAARTIWTKTAFVKVLADFGFVKMRDGRFRAKLVSAVRETALGAPLAEFVDFEILADLGFILPAVLKRNRVV